jgi:hypothetical protein
MVDLNDPMYEFLKDDPVFLMDLFNDYDLGPEPTVVAGVLEPAAAPRQPGHSAVKLAASDNPGRSHQASPAAPATRESRRRSQPAPVTPRRHA